jgi:hypothetical protein
MEDQTLYNQITVKNIDDEDFTFWVNREQYLIGAGEIRIFPKFMVRPMLKHLIDKMLIKKDPEGKLLRNQTLRDELASQIVLKEETYQKPVAPTDKELVEKMNTQPELDRVLERNKTRQKEQEPVMIDPSEVDTAPIETPPAGAPLVKSGKVTGKPKDTTVVETQSQPVPPVALAPAPTTETFDQIEDEQNKPLPTRDQMLKYAQDVLKLDVNEPKTKKAWDAMNDEQLFVELGLDKEENLEELGIK